jgi:hypothetical protein
MRDPITFDRLPAKPAKTTKCEKLFHMLGKRWMTAADSMELCGVLSLSQRVSEWRAEGVQIMDKWLEVDGSRFKMYRRFRGRP